MLQLLGACMVLLGSIGIGCTYIEKERKIIHVIEKWEHIMQMFISEITYKKQPLDLACMEIGEKIKGKEGECLKNIYGRMQNKGRDRFGNIWNEECRNYGREEKIAMEVQEILEEFGTLTGFEDEEVQRKMMEEQKEKWKNLRVRKQEGHQERKKLIWVLSSCMGAMAILILW